MKTKMKTMKKYHRMFLLLAACVLLAGCGKQKGTSDADNEELYGELIAGLGDEEQFSLCDIGEQNDVLFTSNLTYDDLNGHNAAAVGALHYAFDGEVYSVDVESAGTAYPICYGDKCVYTASGHSLNIYRFDQKKKQWTVSLYVEIPNGEGDSTYQLTEDGETKAISAKDYGKVLEEYTQGTVVNFGYGASDNPS